MLLFDADGTGEGKDVGAFDCMELVEVALAT